MQNVNLGQPAYPMYPNCFDVLTTHGIVAEDMVGYITGKPSPYLQNYVAQRGMMPQTPYMMGQTMPMNVPAQMAYPQANNTPSNGYHTNIPRVSDLNEKTFSKPTPWHKVQVAAASLLLIGLTTLGVVKGKKLFTKLFRKTPAPVAAPVATAPAATATAAPAGRGFLNKIKNHKKAVIGTVAGILGVFGIASLFKTKTPAPVVEQYNPNQPIDMSAIPAQEIKPEPLPVQTVEVPVS